MTDGIPLEIRAACLQDAAEIERFLLRHRAEMSVRRGGKDFVSESELHATDVSETISDSDPVFVCIAKDVVIGIARVALRQFAGATRGNLEICVQEGDPRAERAVIELFDLAESWMGEHQVSAIDIHVLPGDQLLKSKLEERGFKARLLVMHR